MGKLSRKLVSIITTVAVASGMAFTAFPASQVKASDISAGTYAQSENNIQNALQENALPAGADYGLTERTKEGTILHAWCWSFNTIKNNMADIAQAGYSTVQTSPANECIVGDGGGMDLMGNGKWYYHYQPTDWKLGNYQLGSREDFKSMCAEADRYGVKIIVDVLPNHTTPTLGAVSQDLKNAAGGQNELYHEIHLHEIGRAHV